MTARYRWSSSEIKHEKWFSEVKYTKKKDTIGYYIKKTEHKRSQIISPIKNYFKKSSFIYKTNVFAFWLMGKVYAYYKRYINKWSYRTAFSTVHQIRSNKLKSDIPARIDQAEKTESSLSATVLTTLISRFLINIIFRPASEHDLDSVRRRRLINNINNEISQRIGR